MDYYLVHTEGGGQMLLHKDKWPKLLLNKEEEIDQKLGWKEGDASQESLGAGEVEHGIRAEMSEPKEGTKNTGTQLGEKKTLAKRRFQLVVVARKSFRTHKPPHEAEGTHTILTNTFTVLNSCGDETLENIAHECDVRLGTSREEVRETLSAMKLAEQARAAVPEANYKHHLQEKLDRLHCLEGENLELGIITNKERGGMANREGGKQAKGNRLGASSVDSSNEFVKK
jgi:hypothetical protein